MRFSGVAIEHEVVLEPFAVADCVLRKQQQLHLAECLHATIRGLQQLIKTVADCIETAGTTAGSTATVVDTAATTVAAATTTMDVTTAAAAAATTTGSAVTVVDATAAAVTHHKQRPNHLHFPPYFHKVFPGALVSRFPPNPPAAQVSSHWSTIYGSATSPSAATPNSSTLQALPAVRPRHHCPTPQLYLIKPLQGEPLIVKFFERDDDQAKQVYMATSDAGIGPKVFVCDPVENTSWWVVHMEYLEHYKSVRQLTPDLSPEQFEHLRKDVEAQVAAFHQLTLPATDPPDEQQAGIKVQFAHGDLRVDNILVKECSSDICSGSTVPSTITKHYDVRIIDYDWAGVTGKARYPPIMNPEVRWDASARPGALLQQSHDKSLVQHQLESVAADISDKHSACTKHTKTCVVT